MNDNYDDEAEASLQWMALIYAIGAGLFVFVAPFVFG